METKFQAPCCRPCLSLQDLQALHHRSLTANASEKWCLEDDPYLLGFGNFSGVNSLLNFGGGV